ncbi:hypothetical protein LCGC14_3096070 [marine sediment metagenome]|uniref:Uncharacterized protein n=1 Tax=marine sediment metagenome TaxID=412755 RepID=A0A0F8YGK9_9ZZZZ
MDSEEIWKRATKDDFREFAKSIGFQKRRGIVIDDTHDMKEGEPSFFEYNADADVMTDIHLDAEVWVNDEEFFNTVADLAEMKDSDFVEWYAEREYNHQKEIEAGLKR